MNHRSELPLIGSYAFPFRPAAPGEEGFLPDLSERTDILNRHPFHTTGFQDLNGSAASGHPVPLPHGIRIQGFRKTCCPAGEYLCPQGADVAYMVQEPDVQIAKKAGFFQILERCREGGEGRLQVIYMDSEEGRWIGIADKGEMLIQPRKKGASDWTLGGKVHEMSAVIQLNLVRVPRDLLR